MAPFTGGDSCLGPYAEPSMYHTSHRAPSPFTKKESPRSSRQSVEEEPSFAPAVLLLLLPLPPLILSDLTESLGCRSGS